MHHSNIPMQESLITLANKNSSILPLHVTSRTENTTVILFSLFRYSFYKYSDPSCQNVEHFILLEVETNQLYRIRCNFPFQVFTQQHIVLKFSTQFT